MLMKLLDACDYLLVVLVLLPGSNTRSLNADQLGRKNSTAEEAKSFPSLKEFDNFVDGQCPPGASSQDLNNIDGKCNHECSSDADCTEDYKCCEDGCSFVCMEPWFPNRIVDWPKSTSLNQISDDPELPNGPWKSRGEPCSTSVLDGLRPLSCPTNYVCQITVDGDVQLNIPNRGECVRINEKKAANGITTDANHEDFSILDTECSHEGETYKHKEKFRKDCHTCLCHHGVVFCDNRPCPVRVGIPAAVSKYKEHRQTSRSEYVINNDSEQGDTEDALGYSGETEGSVVDEEYIDDYDQPYSGDEESEEVISDDEDAERQREVDGDDDRKDGSPENQGKSNNQEFGGESGSAELETKEPPEQESFHTVTETSTLAPETSALAPGTSTLPETSTLTKETSTLAPGIEQKETSTRPVREVKIDDNLSEHRIEITNTNTSEIEMSKPKTTKSPRLTRIEPTVGVIRLQGSDYEASGERNENYSGSSDVKDESSGTGEDYESSSEDSGEQPEPTYPGTIVLGKYVKEAEHIEESGFEPVYPRIDVVNDGSLKRSKNRESEEKSGDEGTASIVGGKGLGRRKGQTLEYLETTDDEH